MAQKIILYERECMDFTVVKGDTFGPLAFNFTEVGYDWSAGGGTTIRMQWKKKPNSSDVVDVSPVPSYSTDKVSFTIEISGATIDAIAAGDYLYDIKVERPDGKIRRSIYGTVTIDDRVTD